MWEQESKLAKIVRIQLGLLVFSAIAIIVSAIYFDLPYLSVILLFAELEILAGTIVACHGDVDDGYDKVVDVVIGYIGMFIVVLLAFSFIAQGGSFTVACITASGILVIHFAFGIWIWANDWARDSQDWQAVKRALKEVFSCKLNWGIPQIAHRPWPSLHEYVEKGKSELKQGGKIGWKLLFFGGILTLIVIFAVKYSSIIAFFMVYSWIASKVGGVVLNPYLANVVAIIIAVIFWFVIYHLVFSANRSKREIGIAAFGGLMIIHALGLYFYTEDKMVDPVSGQVIKYCIRDKLTDELEFFDSPAFNQLGQQAKLCRPDEIAQFVQLKRQSGELAKPEEEAREMVKRKEVLALGLKIFFIAAVSCLLALLVVFGVSVSWNRQEWKKHGDDLRRALASLLIVAACALAFFLIAVYFFATIWFIVLPGICFLWLIVYWRAKWIETF